MIVPFNQFIIEKEDPIAKTKQANKYRNFYKVGWIDNTIYFYDRLRLVFFSES